MSDWPGWAAAPVAPRGTRHRGPRPAALWRRPHTTSSCAHNASTSSSTANSRSLGSSTRPVPIPGTGPVPTLLQGVEVLCMASYCADFINGIGVEGGGMCKGMASSC
jgi:hypothetical protein